MTNTIPHPTSPEYFAALNLYMAAKGVDNSPTVDELAGLDAKRYTYNTSGQLVKVEAHDGNAYQNQAEMIYNGSGQRLALTAFAAGQTLTTTYVLDGNNLLAATAEGQTTYYLQGRGIIGEVKQTWSFNLADGLGSVRQVTDIQGQVTLSRSFTPWGELLDQTGAGDATWGYLGGVLDAATGLIYVGNGQYYDPATGRFLSRGVNPGAVNPYVLWQGDPLGLLIPPLALVAVFGGKRKNGKARRYAAVLLVLLAASVFTLGMIPGEENDPGRIPPTQPAGGSGDPAPSQPGNVNDDPSPQSPSKSTVPPRRCIPSPLWTPIREYIGEFNLSAYYTADESETRWTGSKIPMKASPTKSNLGNYLTYYNHYWTFTAEPECKENGIIRCAKRDFLEAHDGVCMQGSGMLETGEIISCTEKDPVFEWKDISFVRPFFTVARYTNSRLLSANQLIYVDSPWFNSFLDDYGNSCGYLRVTDTGGGLITSTGYESIDLYLGLGEKALAIYINRFRIDDSSNEKYGRTYWPIYRIMVDF